MEDVKMESISFCYHVVLTLYSSCYSYTYPCSKLISCPRLFQVLPEIQTMAVAPLQKSLKHYQDMADNNKPNLQENADGDPANGKC